MRKCAGYTLLAVAPGAASAAGMGCGLTDAAGITQIELESVRSDGDYRTARVTYAFAVPYRIGFSDTDGGEDVCVVDCARRRYTFAHRAWTLRGVSLDGLRLERSRWPSGLQRVPDAASGPRAVGEAVCKVSPEAAR